MSEILTCPIAADGERVHRYVAGTLELENVTQFEAHLLGCAECQAAVREGAAVAAALRRISAPVVGAGTLGRRRLWWAVPLTVAAAGALWFITNREGPLAKLGRVAEAPAFAGVPVRGDSDSASRLADSGMIAYGAGQYGDAARLLSAVPEEARTAGLRFYLGVSLLLTDAARDAVRQLADVSADSPYAAEAHFYRAKAWLRLGQADSALAELDAVEAGTSIGAHAAALADSVKEARR
ncbi:MAG TPA: zf-HC2 domain-containing protein [Gemmatimonadales bacterium]|jgi:hypothetical protein